MRPRVSSVKAPSSGDECPRRPGGRYVPHAEAPALAIPTEQTAHSHYQLNRPRLHRRQKRVRAIAEQRRSSAIASASSASILKTGQYRAFVALWPSLELGRPGRPKGRARPDVSEACLRMRAPMPDVKPLISLPPAVGDRAVGGRHLTPGMTKPTELSHRQSTTGVRQIDVTGTAQYGACVRANLNERGRKGYGDRHLRGDGIQKSNQLSPQGHFVR